MPRLGTPSVDLKADAIRRLADACGCTFSYQHEAILANHRKSIYNKGRGIGITKALSFKKLIKAIRKPSEQVVISRSQEQAKHVMDYVQSHWYTLQAKLGKRLHTRVVNMGLTYMRFSNGSKFVAVSSSPDAARTYHGDVLVDEFAFFKRGLDRKLLTALAGVLSSGGDLEIVSTPNGETGEFFRIWNDPVSAFHKVLLPWTVRPDQLYHDTVEADRKDMFPLEFAQEYECQFTSEASQPFSPTLVDSLTEDYAYNEYAPAPEKERFAGGDFAKEVDATVLIGGELEAGDVVRVRMAEEFEKMDYSDQETEIKLKDEKFGPIEWYMDKTGPGVPIVESLEKLMGAKIVGVTFTNALKEWMFTNIKKRMLDRKLILPSGFEVLLEQLKSLEKVVTADGLIRYRHPWGRRDDAVWALGLMLRGFALHDTGGAQPEAKVGEKTQYQAVKEQQLGELGTMRIQGEAVFPGRQPTAVPVDDSFFVRPKEGE